MGQGACCQTNPNDPNLNYYNSGKPMQLSTPPQTSKQGRQSRRSQRDIGSARSSNKYLEAEVQPEVSNYVKEKMRELNKF